MFNTNLLYELQHKDLTDHIQEPGNMELNFFINPFKCRKLTIKGRLSPAPHFITFQSEALVISLSDIVDKRCFNVKCSDIQH